MKIVIVKTNGSVAIMSLVGDAGATECVNKWREIHGGEYVSHKVVSDDAIPTDRELRDSWVLVGDAVVVP